MEPSNTVADSAPFPLIELTGAPHERGVQYGTQASAHIRRTLALYRPAFERGGLSGRSIARIAAAYFKRIEAYSPEMAAELEGIAAGADLRLIDIVAINARTELLYAHSPRQRKSLGEEPDDGCTGALALPAACAGGRVIHGQNWDWRDECKDTTVVLRIRPEQGPAVLTMVEAGLLGRCGMNSAGIALTGNYLQCEQDFSSAGVPLPLVRRSALEAPSLRDAMFRIFNAPRSFSANMTLSDAAGEGVNLETTPQDVFWSMPEDGLIVHANHFMSVGALARLRDIGLRVTPDSLYRVTRVRSRLERERGAITAAVFADAFADRYGTPYAVCRTSVEDVARGKKTSTVATIIMDVQARRLWIAPTPYVHERAIYWQYDFESAQPTRRDP